MSGRGCRAAVDAGMRSPRGGRFLPRSWRGAASSRGTARRAGLGWAEARWAGARLRAACWRAGPASAGGPETRRKAHEGKNKIFQINLNSFSIQTNFWTKSKQFQTLGQK